MTRSKEVSRLGSRWWFGWLALASVLILSCAAPSLPPATTESSPPSRDPVETPVETKEAVQTHETDPAPRPDRPAPQGHQTPRLQRDGLERRLEAVVTCLEKARQAVVAAEIAGAGIEAVRPAIDALNRAEVALREAQSHLIRGDDAETVSPLERAESECRTARASGHS